MLNQAGEFLPLSHWDLSVLSEIFRREVCRMLRGKGLLTEERLRLLYSWRHSGFHVHIGAPVEPRRNSSALEGLARYLVRAPVRHAQLLVDAAPSEQAELSANSNRDLPGDSTVLLRLQRPDVITGASVERLSALELLARLSHHVPQPYQSLRFYYGAYSNLARHRRAALSESEQRWEQQERQAGVSRKAWRRRWAYLIDKIYGEDPLLCPHCGGQMNTGPWVE
jgi:Putative transposase